MHVHDKSLRGGWMDKAYDYECMVCGWMTIILRNIIGLTYITPGQRLEYHDLIYLINSGR
jgi:hypothetical protein